MNTSSTKNGKSKTYIDKKLFIYRHKKNIDMLRKNYAELDNLFQKLHEKDEVERIWKGVLPDELDELIFEITRLLSNFVCMAKAIVDVNRVLLIKNIDNDQFLKENRLEITKRFSNNSMVQFIEGLRNYSLHYESPIGNIKLIMFNDQITNSEFLLKKYKLKQWDGWKKGKEFLNAQGDDIYIEKIIRKYYAVVLDYNQWFLSKAEKL